MKLSKEEKASIQFCAHLKLFEVCVVILLVGKVTTATSDSNNKPNHRLVSDSPVQDKDPRIMNEKKIPGHFSSFFFLLLLLIEEYYHA